MAKTGKSRYFKKVFILYVLICLVPIGIFTAFSLRELMRKSAIETKERYEQTAESLCDALTDRFNTMASLGNQLKMTNWVARLRSNSNVLFGSLTLNRYYEIRNDITLYEVLVSVSNQIGIFLPYRQVAVTRSGLVQSARLCANFPVALSDAEGDALIRYLSQANTGSIVNLKALGLSGADDSDLMLTFVLDDLKKPRAVMYCCVSGARMKRLLALDGVPNVLDIAMRIDGTEIARYASAASGERTYAASVSRHVSQLTVEYEVAFTGSLYPSGLSAFTALFGAIGLALLFSFALSYLLANVTYRPIRRLADTTGALDDGAADGDVLAGIETQFGRLRDEKQTLRNQLDEYEIIMRNQLLASLLHGLFAWEGRPDAAIRLSLRAEGRYQVTVFQNATSVLGAVGYARAYMKLENSGICADMLRGEENDWVLISEAEDAGRLDALFAEEMELVESFKGMPQTGVLGISKSYYDARQLTHMRYFYPTEWEIQWINQLKLGDGDVALRILSQLRDENEKMGISPQAMDALLSALNETLWRVAREMYSDADAIFASQRAEGGKDRWERLARMVSLLRNQIDTTQDDENARLGDSLLAYVNEHYCDPELSLTSLQNAFHYSQPVLSRVFKKAAKLTYYDYLSRLRIEEAKRRMRNRREAIGDIAVAVGYTSEITFQRAFKRYEGVSPREYAQNCAQEGE